MEVQPDHTGDKTDLKPSGLATETDRFGFILGNGISVGEGPSPVLVRHREVKWLSIISNWDDVSQRRSSKVKGQCQKGIPASLRAKCWPLLCGAMKRMSQNMKLYKILDESPALQSWVDVIERDTDRQFPFHEMFLSKDGHGQRELFRVLKVYTQFRPEEGYCQAQGPVAAVLLMNMPAEEAFWCLVQISELYLPGYYSPLLEGVLFDAAMLPWVLKRACPAAHRHLQRQGVEPLMFATDWLMCLYTRHLPFNTLLRVWDLFFCYGVRVLFQVAVVLVRRVLGRGDQREECEGQMETLERLRGVKDYLQQEDADTFIQEVCSVSLSERDLQRRAERELEKWRKERPNSTFDPRDRCHGYLMAWERVKEMEEQKQRKEMEKGNLSLPLLRSPSSLSPSLLRKRWKKRGSRVSEDSQCEGSAGEQRLLQGEKRKSSNDSTGSTESPQTGVEEAAIITTSNPCPSNQAAHFRTPSDWGTTSTGSEQLETHTHREEEEEEEGEPPDPIPTCDITTSSESDGTLQKGDGEMGQTACDHKEGGPQQTHTAQEGSQTVKDEQAVEAQVAEDAQQGDLQTKEAEEDREIQQTLEDKNTTIVEEKDEDGVQTVKDKSEVVIQVMQEEETQTVKTKDKEMQTVDKQKEPMQSAKERPEREVQTVEDEQQEETRDVTDEQEPQSSKDEQREIKSQTEHQDERHDRPYTEEFQMSAGQDEWEGQTQQEVTYKEVTCQDDLNRHRGKQDNSVQVRCSDSIQAVAEEVQPDRDDVKEQEGDEDKEEKSRSSSLSQGIQPKESMTSPNTPPDECLNSDLTPPQPQRLMDTGGSSATQSTQTDEGPCVVEDDDHHTLSPLVDTHSKAPTATPQAVRDQERPQEMEVMTEVKGAIQGHTGCRDRAVTAEHMEEMEVRTEGFQEEAFVNTQTPTTVQEICSAFSGRPQLQTDPSDSPQSVTDDRGELTVTAQLTTPPLSNRQSASATQDTRTDTSTPLKGIQVHQDNEPEPEHHRPCQLEEDVDAEELKDYTGTIVNRGETENRPEGDSGKTPELVETMSDPVSLSHNSPDKADLKESQGESKIEKAELFAEGKEDREQELADTEDLSRPLNSDTQNGTDSVVPLNGAEAAGVTSHTEPVTEGIKDGEVPPSTSGPVRVRRYSSSSRSSYPRVLSEDIFKDPKDTPRQDCTPAQPTRRSPSQTDEQPATKPTSQTSCVPASRSRSPSHTQETTQDSKHTYLLSKVQTLNPADMGNKQTDSSKRLGLFQRLRGGAKSSTPRIAIPKILIQDFSEEAEEEKLTSKERRKRRREKKRTEKEEEKLRKKREKEMEKERDRERKKPQTRGKSFQLPSSPMRSKDIDLRRSDSQTLVSRRNSTPFSENYF
ncbi:hypothetical protein ACEWY4_027353 [Coilia grayii]|uniref:Rab-GAP TBC domain-containing protein n=1 Tax=Coilia grayii TaxID=363190 RepID=A0ABD1IS50_9TELE